MSKVGLPYSVSRKHKDFMFISGQLPICSTNEKFPKSIEDQVSCSLENLKNVIESEGYTMGDVLKTTVFLADISYLEPMTKIYTKFFPQPFPARSAIAVSGLPKGALVEVEAVVAI